MWQDVIINPKDAPLLFSPTIMADEVTVVLAETAWASLFLLLSELPQSCSELKTDTQHSDVHLTWQGGDVERCSSCHYSNFRNFGVYSQAIIRYRRTSRTVWWHNAGRKWRLFDFCAPQIWRLQRRSVPPETRRWAPPEFVHHVYTLGKKETGSMTTLNTKSQRGVSYSLVTYKQDSPYKKVIIGVKIGIGACRCVASIEQHVEPSATESQQLKKVFSYSCNLS